MPEGLEVCGFQKGPDWPKLGPSLLIASALVLAIRTARSPATGDTKTSEIDLGREIDHAIHLAGRVLSRLLATKPTLFPQRDEPWFQPTGEDQPE